MSQLRTHMAIGQILVRCIAALSIAAIPVMASAQWWNPQSSIAPGKWAMLGKTFVYDDLVFDQAKQVIGSAIEAGDYAKLDRMHDEFLAMEQAGGNGARMLDAFTYTLQWAFHPDRTDRYRAFFAEWREHAPDSRLRPAVEATMWWSLAWNARGGGYGSDVPPEAWKTFRERLDRAVGALRDGAAKGEESPLWHWMAISVAGSRGEPAAVLDHLCDEGVRKFPLFLPIYYARVNFLLPQWGGDYGQVDAFIRRAVMRTQASEGTTLYAALYMDVNTKYRGEDFFRETKASWPLMKHAFEDQVDRKSVDLNAYATFACMAGDRDAVRDLLAELGDKANLGAGGSGGFTTESCAQLVAEGK